MKYYRKLKKGRVAVSGKIPEEVLKDILGIEDKDQLVLLDNAFIVKGDIAIFNALVQAKIPCKTIIGNKRKSYLRLYDGVKTNDYRVLDGETVVERSKLDEIRELLENDNEIMALLKVSYLTLDENIGDMECGGQLHHVTIVPTNHEG